MVQRSWAWAAARLLDMYLGKAFNFYIQKAGLLVLKYIVVHLKKTAENWIYTDIFIIIS